MPSLRGNPDMSYFSPDWPIGLQHGPFPQPEADDMADDDRLYGTFAHHRRGADHLLLIGTHGSTTGCGLTIDGLDWALSDFTVRVNEVDDLRAPFRMCKRCWASFDADPRRYLTAFGKGS